MKANCLNFPIIRGFLYSGDNYYDMQEIVNIIMALI